MKGKNLMGCTEKRATELRSPTQAEMATADRPYPTDPDAELRRSEREWWLDLAECFVASNQPEGAFEAVAQSVARKGVSA